MLQDTVSRIFLNIAILTVELQSRNCAAAILALPPLTEPLVFHRLGPNDWGRLPVIRGHGDCLVAVDMGDLLSELSTWTSISLAANLLMTACAEISSSRPYTGGYARAGRNRGIRLALLRKEAGAGKGNATSEFLTE